MKITRRRALGVLGTVAATVAVPFGYMRKSLADAVHFENGVLPRFAVTVGSNPHTDAKYVYVLFHKDQMPIARELMLRQTDELFGHDGLYLCLGYTWRDCDGDWCKLKFIKTPADMFDLYPRADFSRLRMLKYEGPF